jgi:hypothetical protein
VERSSTLEHPSEHVLEEYAFGRLAEPAAEVFEEHLLTCTTCQHALETVDEYIVLMKSVTANFSARDWRYRMTRPRMISVAAMATASVFCLITLKSWRTEAGPIAPVTLAALRGNENLPVAYAPAGRALELQVDMPGLVVEAPYVLEIVNAIGQRTWKGQAAATTGRVVASVPRGMKAGVYWVRMYSGTELLREFGLRVE